MRGNFGDLLVFVWGVRFTVFTCRLLLGGLKPPTGVIRLDTASVFLDEAVLSLQPDPLNRLPYVHVIIK